METDLRRWIRLVESQPVSRATFLATLKTTLAQITGGATYATTALQVNQGLCAEFAGSVVKAFGFKPYDQQANPRVTSTKWYWDDNDNLDLAKIQAFGEPVPLDLLPRLDYQVRRALGGVHYWLVFNHRHYDAECLQGVDHFLDLPFFQRMIQWLRDGMPEDEST